MTLKQLEAKYADILKFQGSKKEEEVFNLFDIGETLYSENIISNWYAFFFDTEEKHNLKNLFLASICELISAAKGSSFEMKTCSVIREHHTGKGFIDLVLHTGEGNDKKTGYESAIIIENKINASLTNDLADYYDSIKASEENKVGVLLTLNPIDSGNDNFVNITHVELARQVRQNLSSYILRGKQRYILYLMDFLSTIEFITKTNEMDDEIKFCIKHGAKIDELIALKNDANKYVIESLKRAIGGKVDFVYFKMNSEFITTNISNTNLYLDIVHSMLFNSDQYEVGIWIKGLQEIKRFNENSKLEFEQVFKNIETDWEVDGDYLLISKKLYPNPSEDELDNVGELIFDRIEKDFSSLISWLKAKA